MAELLEILKNLPNEDEREYELQLTKLATSEDFNLREKLEKILETKSIEEHIRYAAFFCLATLFRRRQDISLYERLINDFKAEFSKHPTFKHINILFLKAKGLSSNNILEVIELAYESQLILYNHSGAIHCFAETVAQGYEESNDNIRTRIKSDWLEKAQNSIDKAIEIEPRYAKYHCTKGRLLAINRQFNLAKEAIRKAMDYENSESSDYIMRIGQYQYYLIKVQTIEYNALMEEQIKLSEISFNEKLRAINKTFETKTKDVDDKIKENNIRNLEFLGFFTAIVSFTIGSLQLAHGETFDNALKLIIVLFASILIVFSAFGLVLHKISFKEVFKTPNFIMFIIGILLYLFVLNWR